MPLYITRLVCQQYTKEMITSSLVPNVTGHFFLIGYTVLTTCLKHVVHCCLFPHVLLYCLLSDNRIAPCEHPSLRTALHCTSGGRQYIPIGNGHYISKALHGNSDDPAEYQICNHDDAGDQCWSLSYNADSRVCGRCAQHVKPWAWSISMSLRLSLKACHSQRGNHHNPQGHSSEPLQKAL